MEKQINQQQTLFRFISIRPPELTEIGSKLKFVNHPGDAGVYFTAVANRPLGQTKWEAMAKASETFPAYDSVKSIESKHANQSQASSWLAKNKDNATSQELYDKVKSISALSSADIITLWDNLFYQIITQRDFYVKELVAQLLILQNLLDEVKRIADPAEVVKVIKQLANTSTVLPVKLFVEDPAETSPDVVEEEPLFSTKQLNKSLDNLFNTYAIDRDNTAITELKKLQSKYADYYREAYNEAISSYERNTEEAYRNATYTEREIVECPSGCPITVRDYEDLQTPPFNFSPAAEVSPTILKEKLTEESYYVVESLGLLQEKTYSSIIAGIENSIIDYNAKLASSQPESRVVAFGNMVFADNSSEANTNVFLNQSQLPFVAAYKKTAAEKGKIFMSVDVGYRGAEVASASYTARINGTEVKGNGIASSAQDNMVNLVLFPNNNGLNVPKDIKDFDLDVSVTLTDATKFTITKPVNVQNPIKGVGTIIGQNTTGVIPHIAFEPQHFGLRRLGIADYKKVVSEVCCYRESEVSHIENIMAREFRSKSTTRERIEETTTTTENQYEQENLTDISTSERFEMQRETNKILQQDKQIGAYGKLWGSMGNTKFEVGGTYASNTAKEESNRQAIIESREVTERASERITTRFREELVRKITERFREDNSHVFDNRMGENHVSGVYRFINAIYKNQIFNYGKRLMYEFMVPDPSRLHRLGSEMVVPDSGSSNGIQTLEMPLHPKEFGYIDSTKIVDSNYMWIASKYGASVEAPPAMHPYIGKAIHGAGGNGANAKEHNEIKIPEGYRVTLVRYAFSMMKSYNNLYTRLQIGNDTITVMANPYFPGYATSHSSLIWFPPTSDKYTMESLPVSIIGWDLAAYVLNLSVQLERTPELFENWQIKTYNAIVAAYEERLAEYNQRMSELQQEPEAETVFGTNPLFYREIEQITLKRNCLSYLLDNNVMGTTDFTGGDFTSFSVTRNQQMDDYTSLTKFLEQAFEWNIMSYSFYPYYWASKNRWVQLYQTDNDDAEFREFMQAGMARVIVTVRPGFEKAVMYYMATKRVWNGGQIPLLGDPLYMSISDELEEQEYTVEETWETVVPTSLIGLQKDGVAIDVSGLPCGGGCEVPEDPTHLIPNNSKLGPEIPPTA